MIPADGLDVGSCDLLACTNLTRLSVAS